MFLNSRAEHLEQKGSSDQFALGAIALTGLLAACAAPIEKVPAVPTSPEAIARVEAPLTDREIAAMFHKVLNLDPAKNKLQQIGADAYFQNGGKLGLDIQDPNNPHRLEIDKSNYQQNWGWVVGYLRQVRFAGNPLLGELHSKVESGTANRIEQCVHDGIWYSPSSNSAAFNRAMTEFHIGTGPLGTERDLRLILAKINSSDTPCINIGNDVDGNPVLCSVAEITGKILRNPAMYLTLTAKSSTGETQKIEFDGNKIREDEDRYRSALFSFRVQQNPILTDLAARRELGATSGFELAAYQAVMKRPDDAGAAYLAAVDELKRLQTAFPARVGEIKP